MTMLHEYLNDLKNILAELNPYRAVLFGSYAKVPTQPDSDIDLIVRKNRGKYGTK